MSRVGKFGFGEELHAAIPQEFEAMENWMYLATRRVHFTSDSTLQWLCVRLPSPSGLAVCVVQARQQD